MRPDAIIEILEGFTIGKKPGYSEDRLFISDGFVVVVDGVTSLTGVDAAGSGSVAADMVAGLFDVFAPDITAREAVDLLSWGLTDGAAVFAAYSRARNEVWRVGDVHVAVDGDVPPVIGADRDDDAIRERVRIIRELTAAGVPVEEAAATARATIEPMLLRVRERANIDYGVLYHGASIPDRLIEVFPGGAEIVLASDGYLSPAWSIEEAERAVSIVNSRDPYRFILSPGTKGVPEGGISFDDRTYVRFRTAPIIKPA